MLDRLGGGMLVEGRVVLASVSQRCLRVKVGREERERDVKVVLFEGTFFFDLGPSSVIASAL